MTFIKFYSFLPDVNIDLRIDLYCIFYCFFFLHIKELPKYIPCF